MFMFFFNKFFRILEIKWKMNLIYLNSSGGSNYGLGAGTLLPADLDKLDSALSLILNGDR